MHELVSVTFSNPGVLCQKDKINCKILTFLFKYKQHIIQNLLFFYQNFLYDMALYFDLNVSNF